MTLKYRDNASSKQKFISKKKINLAKPTVIKWLRKTQRKRDICTFDYSLRVMNNHAWLALTRPTGTTFSHTNTQ